VSQTITLREIAWQAIIDSVYEGAANGHRRNYHKLHIYRDGDVRWTEHIDRSDDIIDRAADHFAAIPSVACVGTGPYACNCDYCNEIGDKEEAIREAAANSDLSDLEAAMLAEFERVPTGYFDDEEAK